MADRNINVRLVDNNDAGENKNLEITENMSVQQFVENYLKGRNPETLLIRVNGRQVARSEAEATSGQPTMSTPLQARDKISVSPAKVEGAH